MRKKLRNAIILFALLILLNGCSTGQDTTTKSISNITSSIKTIVVPEPYTMAMQEIKEQNLDKALRYLDLVIKDFPDNEEYIYRAYFLKTVIYTDYYSANIRISDALLEGVKDNPFIKTEEAEQILNTTQVIINEIDNYKQPYLASIKYIFEHYEKHKNLDFPLNYSCTNSSTEALNAVDWFRQSGTPTPSEEQINLALRDARLYLLGLAFDELIKKDKVNYPAYFYATGSFLSEWDEELSMKLAEKIIEITKDDKYNKYRLDAEDALKAFKLKNKN